MRPDFSPEMLGLFIRSRAMMMASDAGVEPERLMRDLPHYIGVIGADLAPRARVTKRAVHRAAAGKLKNAEMRARLWGALGIVPADHGVRLTNGGQENG